MFTRPSPRFRVVKSSLGLLWHVECVSARRPEAERGRALLDLCGDQPFTAAETGNTVLFLRENGAHVDDSALELRTFA